MKIRIILDVYQNWQGAFVSSVFCGDSTLSLPLPANDSKRYKVEVDVPHPTDAEKIEGKLKEIKEESND